MGYQVGVRFHPSRIARGLPWMLMALFCSGASALRADLWCTAYYAAWMQGVMPASNVDFTAVTHVIHFSVVPNANGSLDTNINVLTPAHCSDVVTRAHAAKRKVLLSVGGGGSQSGFQGATSGAHRPAFISNLVNMVTNFGYDGLDLDWEPLDAGDIPQFTNLVNELRAALDTIQPRPLLTAAAALQPATFAQLQSKFDQINVMTYDLAGPWGGWVTWFNSPIYDGGYRFASTGGLIPSADGMLTDFITNGVAASKLGLGMDFYGVIWSGGAGTSNGGATLPRQSWSTAPAVTPASYDLIMSNYYSPARYAWDADAQAAYLSINNAGSANDKFISYDDEHSVQAKISYARNRRIGGVMIWELGGGWRPGLAAGRRDPLLQAVKAALVTPQPSALWLTGPDLQFEFTTLPLGLYRIEWTSNLATGPWVTLSNNLLGTGNVLRVTDPGAFSWPGRFYRVLTPP
ncbi:MAG: glycoside hydrolase family 18 protein [Verrucomicrobia bacterium]|nr:glycoside hydrolase family 18 protein [Verrucomicrobiota bacterium]